MAYFCIHRRLTNEAERNLSHDVNQRRARNKEDLMTVRCSEWGWGVCVLWYEYPPHSSLIVEGSNLFYQRHGQAIEDGRRGTMAAFNRPTEATYTIHENVTVDTSVKCKDLLPLDHVVIKSVAVRGGLGPMTVWVSNEDEGNGDGRVRLNSAYWTKLYEKTHRSSKVNYKTLELDQPITLRPGQVRCIYIHSTLPSDEAIVYDNTYYGMSPKRYEDDKIAILTGRAHVSPEVFGQEPIWGWGNAWRDRREFVGRLQYGTVYKLWNPQVQPKFGSNFQNCSRTLSLCQRRWESPFSKLPDECIYYILNMCRWDWFDDDSDTMKERRRREKVRSRAEDATSIQIQNAEPAVAAAPAVESSRHHSCGRASNMETDDEDDDYQAMDGSDSSDEEYEEGMQEEEDDEESNEAAWSDDEEQTNIQSFAYHNLDSDEEGEENEESRVEERSRNQWVRRQFARIHVLRALAAMEDGTVGYVEY
eukprot:scaffold961_cov122-Cylindrotheca_fusiformis.AAC.38